MIASDRQERQIADIEARWSEIKRMMTGIPTWKRAELARRFFRDYADEVAGE